MSEHAHRDQAPELSAEQLPETEPHAAPIFDTGPHPQPLPSLPATAWSLSGLDPGPAEPGSSVAVADPDGVDKPAAAEQSPPTGRMPAPASVLVPGQYHFLKWWKLLLVLAAVWIPAAGVGLALFSWWYTLFDKTPAVFVVLVYLVVCTVAALMMAMVPGKPLVSAFAIAMMSAVFVSALAAAPLYGHYYCQVKGPCVAGIIPY